MGVPSDKLMELMKGSRSAGAPAPGPAMPPGGMPGGAPLPGAMSDAETPPMSSPMSTPEPKMGSKEAAMINVGMAMDLLEQSLPALGSESEEGQKALAAIRYLNSLIGPSKNKTNELQQSEILQMLQTPPPAGRASPERKAMATPPIPGMPSPCAPPPPPM